MGQKRNYTALAEGLMGASGGKMLSGSFADDATAVVRRLRNALASLVQATPAGIRKSRDLQKLFGVDSKLSWQVFKLAGPGEPLTLVPHVPNPVPMRRFLQASKKFGLPVEVIDEVSAAYADFDNLVSHHAGDRTSFDSMARALSNGDESQQADLQHRKAMFKGASHFFGVQIETRVVTYLLHPAVRTPGLFDYGWLRAKFGLRRLRPDADVIVDLSSVTPAPAGADPTHTTHKIELLDPDAAREHGAAIIPRFCTHPLPQLVSRKQTQGEMTITELAGDAVGRRGAADLVFGQVWRDESLAEGEPAGPCFRGAIWMREPTALMIVDLLAHRPSLPALDGHLDVIHEWDRPIDRAERRPVRLPFRERIVRVEGGVEGALLREVPRYGEMLQFACERLNWRLDEFDVYRLTMEYPLHHSTLKLRYAVRESQPAASE